MAPSAFSGPRLAPPISDTVETATIPGTSRGSTCSVLQVGEQARNLLGQAGQTAQQPDDGTGRRGDRHPPPMPAEPARIGVAVPLAPERDHSDEHQAGDRAEHPQGHRVTHQDPELPLLGDRRCRGRPGRDAHDADLSGAEFPARPGRQQQSGRSRSATWLFEKPWLGIWFAAGLSAVLVGITMSLHDSGLPHLAHCTAAPGPYSLVLALSAGSAYGQIGRDRPADRGSEALHTRAGLLGTRRRTDDDPDPCWCRSISD